MDERGAPESGLVSLPASQLVMAVRSYVRPSAVETGSRMIPSVMGHLNWSGTAVTEAAAVCNEEQPRGQSQTMQLKVRMLHATCKAEYCKAREKCM